VAGPSGCLTPPREQRAETGELDELAQLRTDAVETDLAAIAPALEDDAAERIEGPQVRPPDSVHIEDERRGRPSRPGGRLLLRPGGGVIGQFVLHLRDWGSQTESSERPRVAVR
jgi:hypothetical protein